MHHETLIVPGFNGSGSAHWQTWMEGVLPEARRLSGVDWTAPVLGNWSARIAAEIDMAKQPLWIVAHSFGCLATVTAIPGREDRVCGVMLVAPADPERFTDQGCRDENSPVVESSLSRRLPQQELGVPSLVVASSNDHWVKLSVAFYWASRWGSRFVHAGAAGHINTDAGYGPWPGGLDMLLEMQRVHGFTPLGECPDAG